MDIFLAATKKIRAQNGRPYSNKIFKESLEYIQQALQHMVSDTKLINTPQKNLDSFYIVET